MTNTTFDQPEFVERLQSVHHRLIESAETQSPQNNVVDELSLLAGLASSGDRDDLAQGCEILASILELAVCWQSQFPDDEKMDQLVEFAQTHMADLLMVADAEYDEQGRIQAFVLQAEENWNWL